MNMHSVYPLQYIYNYIRNIYPRDIPLSVWDTHTGKYYKSRHKRRPYLAILQSFYHHPYFSINKYKFKVTTQNTENLPIVNISTY